MTKTWILTYPSHHCKLWLACSRWDQDRCHVEDLVELKYSPILWTVNNESSNIAKRIVPSKLTKKTSITANHCCYEIFVVIDTPTSGEAIVFCRSHWNQMISDLWQMHKFSTQNQLDASAQLSQHHLGLDSCFQGDCQCMRQDLEDMQYAQTKFGATKK